MDFLTFSICKICCMLHYLNVRQNKYKLFVNNRLHQTFCDFVRALKSEKVSCSLRINNIARTHTFTSNIGIFIIYTIPKNIIK